MKMRGDIIQMLPRFCILMRVVLNYHPDDNKLSPRR